MEEVRINKVIATAIFGIVASTAGFFVLTGPSLGSLMGSLQLKDLILAVPAVVMACILSWYKALELGRISRIYSMLLGGVIALVSSSAAGISIALIGGVENLYTEPTFSSFISIFTGVFGLALISILFTFWITFPLGAIAGLLTNLILKSRQFNRGD